jgi:hypothetical protein
LADGRRAPVIEAPLAVRPSTLQPFSNSLEAHAELGDDTLPRLATVQVTRGPATIRTENAQLVNYIYVDMHDRDLGSYVADATGDPCDLCRREAPRCPPCRADHRVSQDAVDRGSALNAADLNEADPIAANVKANSHFAPLPAGPGYDSLDRRLSGGNETLALASFEHKALEVAKATISE